ncbi:hypothetical protein [Neogemmobacter tilapiae]|jgi:uncharacterized membrane protein YgdD (TMEM256/DUF423 family)|nr:hypothetical protein [Gemmobacter tilapiae]
MKKIAWMMLALVGLSGCIPVAMGAAGAVVADKAVEQNEGGEGLF